MSEQTTIRVSVEVSEQLSMLSLLWGFKSKNGVLEFLTEEENVLHLTSVRNQRIIAALNEETDDE